ncbi:MAG: hypothetical protein ACE5QW_05325 [Thermoplasmata archaeon]
MPIDCLMNIHQKLKLLGDDDMKHILVATFLSPKSAYELCSKYSIPVASCYRKINLLMNAGLLSVRKRIITRRGRIVRIFQANLNKGHIHIENNRILLRFVLTPDEHADLQTWETIEIL